MSHAQKVSFMKSLSEYGQAQINNNALLEGKGLPCHVIAVNGAIVTVKFDVLPGDLNLPEVTLPVFGPEYIRYPIQVGDKGVTVPLSVSIRNISGLGVGLPDMSRPPSLTSLFFMPIGNVHWPQVDPAMLVMSGPGGVELKTQDARASLSLSAEKIVMTVAGQTLELSAAGLMHNGTLVGDRHTHQVNKVKGGSDTVISEVPT